MASTLNILFLASEAEPFIKVGGLADVAGSLPAALRRLPSRALLGRRLDVRLALPLHRAIRTDGLVLRPAAEFTLQRAGTAYPVQVLQTESNGVPVYLVSGGPIARSGAVYLPDLAADRDKYAFFSLAALEMLAHLDWTPHIVHANDWHTSLALHAIRSRNERTLPRQARTVLTVHNLPFMGSDGSDVLEAYGLEALNEPRLPAWAGTQPLPLGLAAADRIVAVSPSYGREILTPAFGCGLEGYLASRGAYVSGILNGLDTASFDPRNDPALPAHFSAADLDPRAVCKAALQQELGLPQDAERPLLAMIGRIDRQKGVDIVLEVLPRLAGEDWQFVILGSGDALLERDALRLETEHPDRVRAAIRYDSMLARRIYAGADLFLMPSRYEPCGLAQMIAMRYGCIPAVSATGGLKDTVEAGRTGFVFPAADAAEFQSALLAALAAFRVKPAWRKLQVNGMRQDFSWKRSADRYAQLYLDLVGIEPRSQT
jgi:starch synthase